MKDLDKRLEKLRNMKDAVRKLRVYLIKNDSNLTDKQKQEMLEALD